VYKRQESYSDRPPEPPRPKAPPIEAMRYYDAERDRVQCLDCGRWMREITVAHVRTHGHAGIAAYRAAHGLPPLAPTKCRGACEAIGRNWGKTNGGYLRRGTRGPQHRWTAADRALMRREYPVTDLGELAARIGVSVSALKSRAHALKIYRGRWSAPEKGGGECGPVHGSLKCRSTRRKNARA